MTRVNPGSLRNWNDNEVITAGEYKQEREILYTAINGSDTEIKDRYTKAETLALLSGAAGGQAFSFRKGSTFPPGAVEGDVFFLTAAVDNYPANRPYQYAGGQWVEFLVGAPAYTSTAYPVTSAVQIVNAAEKAPAIVTGMVGRTLVNLLGREGGFESPSTYWNVWGSAISGDTSTSYSGTRSVKIVADGSTTSANMYRDNIPGASGRYYVALGRIKNADASRRGLLEIGNTTVSSFVSTAAETTNWELHAVRLASTTSNITVAVKFNASAVNGSTLYADSIRVYEVTQAEYDAFPALTKEQLEAKYPYVDDMKHVNGVHITNLGENLLPPFREWTSVVNAVSVTSPYSATLTATSGFQSSYTFLDVVPNTDYTYSATHNGRIAILTEDASAYIGTSDWSPAQSITFNSGNRTRVRVYFGNGSVPSGTFTFANPMLNIGATAKSFVPQNKSYTYLPDVQLKSNVSGSVADQLYFKDGQARVTRRFREMLLDGGSLTWTYTSDLVAAKQVTCGPVTSALGSSNMTVVKYDGKILSYNSNVNTPDTAAINIATNVLYITVPDVDSGWGETYVPTTAEIAAYFMGWKMCNADGSIPYVSGPKYWKAYNNPNAYADVATTAPLDPVPGYPYYRLAYELAQSVDEPVQSEGILQLHDGANQIEVGTGVVVREALRPFLIGGSYFINHTTQPLKNRSNRIMNVYRNGAVDALWAIRSNYVDNSSAYGGASAYTSPQNFDNRAAYSATYLALDTYALGIAPSSVTISAAKDAQAVLQQLVDDSVDLRRDVDVIENTYARKQQADWIVPTFLNGWTNYGGSYAAASYMKDELGFVRVEGLTSSGTTAAGTVLFRFPPGYRPLKTISRRGLAWNGTSFVACTYDITADGLFKLGAPAANTYLLLSIAPFRAEQ